MITKAEALKIYKKYGVVHDVLFEPLHAPEMAQTVKNIIKRANKESTNANNNIKN
jgi:ATP-dependent RNA circularization protein (DNA/RNA ligase family)